MQSTLAKISVVTPSLNQGEFIEETILSVLNQNYKSIEHVIIDGGSTDSTLSILKKYDHLSWISEPDKGQSDALNKGFQKAKGDWVLWLNADDVLLPNALKTFLDWVNSKPNANVMYGHMTFFNNQSGEIVKKQFFNNFSKLDMSFGIVVPPTTGTLFKKENLLKNPLDTSFHYMMDAEWFLRCRNELKVIRINQFLVKFRISDSNKTSAQINIGYQNQQHKKEQKRFTTMCKEIYPTLSSTMFQFLKQIVRAKSRFIKIKYYLFNS